MVRAHVGPLLAKAINDLYSLVAFLVDLIQIK